MEGQAAREFVPAQEMLNAAEMVRKVRVLAKAARGRLASAVVATWLTRRSRFRL